MLVLILTLVRFKHPNIELTDLFDALPSDLIGLDFWHRAYPQTFKTIIEQLEKQT
jgi:hypothetical protein